VTLARRTWNASARASAPERIGPYTVYGEIGHGGMATVHLGQLRSASGFTRVVAIKRLHANLAKSPEFVAMFVDEAKLAGRVQHPNVVSALDCVAESGDILLVMDYVHGVSLDQAQRIVSKSGQTIPPPIASAIVIGALLGLHAAHEAVDESGRNLCIVHRDASPQNILVGVDGLARVLDFGIAKAAERAHYTQTGEVRGKLAYMAPEQFFQEPVGRETDVYSIGVVLWELLTGRRLFANDTQAQILMRLANGLIDRPSTVSPDLPSEVEAVVMKALARAPADRHRTAIDFATELERCIPPAPQRLVGEWLATTAKPLLVRRLELRSELDGASGTHRQGGVGEKDDVITSRFTLPAAGQPDAPDDGPVARPPRRRSRLVLLSSVAVAICIAVVTVAWSRFSVAEKAPALAADRGSAPDPSALRRAPTDPAASAPARSAMGDGLPVAVGAESDARASATGAFPQGPARTSQRLPLHAGAKPSASASATSTPATGSAAPEHDGSELDIIGGRQ
jgi:serine/threonine protein kinase